MKSIDNDYIATSKNIIQVFREQLHPDVQLQMIAVLLEVALNKEITMKDLKSKTGLSQASISRNIAALSENKLFNKSGYNLVQALEDPSERRRKIVRLTRDGESFMKKLNKVI
ncbi:MAG: MarR family transcriptional regulator [Pseudomonadota bacterium]